MSDEFFLSLRHCLHICTAWRAPFPGCIFFPDPASLAIFPLPGCGDKHENNLIPARCTLRCRWLRQTLPALERTGEIHAHDETTLSFRTGGRIVTRSVDIGDRVNAGQLLATLENTTSQNQLDSARLTMKEPKPLPRSLRLTSTECKSLCQQAR
jgi:hypothetical protein